MKEILITGMEVNRPSYLNFVNNLKNRETIEKEFKTTSGYLMLLISLLLFFGGIGLLVTFSSIQFLPGLAIAIPCIICGFLFFIGFFSLQPNEVAVITMCGSYRGTVEESGYHWISPFNTRLVVSLRSRNIHIEKLKVNDKSGNPIEIGAVIVWRIKHAAKSAFDVVNAENFASLNSESALRHIALSYHYDKENEVSLRTGSAIIIQELVKELQERLEKAGIEVEEARITHLAYAAEIASVMLKRQQAEAIIAARERIVQGAVSIVGHALNALNENKIVDMSNEEKSKLVSNMLVILCSDSHVSPVLNTGV